MSSWQCDFILKTNFWKDEYEMWKKPRFCKSGFLRFSKFMLAFCKNYDLYILGFSQMILNNNWTNYWDMLKIDKRASAVQINYFLTMLLFFFFDLFQLYLQFDIWEIDDITVQFLRNRKPCTARFVKVITLQCRINKKQKSYIRNIK